MNTESQFLGELPPMTPRRRGSLPDRRQVSKRWLTSSVLVGMTSLFLMGGALFTALDGRQQLTLPAQAYEKASDDEGGITLALKGNHPGLYKKSLFKKSDVMMVSTVTKTDEGNVVKKRPFLNITAPMALGANTAGKYPAFNALAVFSDKGDADVFAKVNDSIYGADVESEVTLNVIPFPLDEAAKYIKHRQRTNEVERQVRFASLNMQPGDATVSALSFFDEIRFSDTDDTLLGAGDVRITAENVSTLERRTNDEYLGIYYTERLIEVRAAATISQILLTEGMSEAEATLVEKVLESDLGSNALKKGDFIHTHFEYDQRDTENVKKAVARASIFRRKTHLVSIARATGDRFVYAQAPVNPLGLPEEEDTRPQVAASALPSVYDGIYRAAMSEGLSVEQAGALVKIFAFDVDFRSKIAPEDEIEVFMTLEDGEERPTEESEILYASITLNGLKRRYYRFADTKTGLVDYYDETGKSSKKFLLRKPVPNGRFRSKFGMRRHPISRVFKLHGGVDWSAPHGSPILAAGNGVVEKAGWAGGSGKRTILRHANGYKTYYLHQTRFAKGIRPGVRVRQGRIIGYVGSTGYSTGPHLHYEVHVNGNRVDPMRIRLPKGKVLKGTELATFEADRDGINALVDKDNDATKVASN